MEIYVSQLPIETSRPQQAESSPPGHTNVRRGILGLIMVFASVAALHRLNLSIAGTAIQDQFHLSIQSMGFVFGAFFLGYAIFQVPWGYASDRFGPRIVLTLAIVWWSAFTLASAFAPYFARSWFSVAWSIAVFRFLVGVGEAAVPPGLNKIVSRWVGEGHRARGISYMSIGAGIGGIYTPPVMAWAIRQWGWQRSFFVSGLIGFAMAFAWWRYVRNRPEEHPRISASELNHIYPSGVPQSPGLQGSIRRQAPPWKTMFSSLSVWGLLVSFSFQNYSFFVYYDWFHVYLVRARGLTVTRGGLWTSAPFIAMTLLALLGGLFSDRAVKRFGKRFGRRATVWVGGLCSATLLLIGTHVHYDVIAIPLLAAAAGFNFFPTPTWYATCIDLMPNYAASLSALMNSVAHIAAYISPIVTAYILTRFGWNRALDVAALLTLVPSLVWFFVNANENLEERSNV
jgi:ACS family glucarate transporter-like MFS transporter